MPEFPEEEDLHMRTIFALMIVGFFSSPTSAAPIDDCAEIKPNNKKNVERLIQACTIVLKTEKEDLAAQIGAYNNRGEAYRRSRRYKKAIADYTGAIRVGEQIKPVAYQTLPQLLNLYLTVYRNRGWAHSNSGNYRDAIPDYTKWLSTYPKDYATLVDRGIAYVNTKNYNMAIADYSAALKIKPNHHVILTNRGRAYFLKGDAKRAIAEFNKAIPINRKYANAYKYRSRAHKALGDLRRAKADELRAKSLGN